MRTEEREVRMGAEATEVEASGRKNAWEGREIVTWCPGQAGQAGADGLAMMLSRSPCRGEAGRGGGVGHLRQRCVGKEGLQATLERSVNMRTEKMLAIQGHRCHLQEYGLYRGWAEARCQSVKSGHGGDGVKRSRKAL